jgi:putative ABC transport system substrate-binding protein
MRAAAKHFKGLELIERDASGRKDLERIFGSIKHGDVDGVVSTSVNLQASLTSLLIHLATERRLPLASYRKESVQQGALFSYAPDDAAIGWRAAEYVDRILKGAKPADLPVEQPTAFELVINLKTARILGLTIPSALLARADHVIE